MTGTASKPWHKQLDSLIEQAEYNKGTGEIRVADTDWILIRSSTIRDMIKGTENMLGSAATIVWWEIGKHAGKEFTRGLVRAGTDLTEVPTWLEMFFTQGGWGVIQSKIDFTKKEAVIRIENCATARKTESKEPVCHFVRGFISGVSDVVLDDLTDCRETKCMAKGDPYCEFRIGKFSAFS